MSEIISKRSKSSVSIASIVSVTDPGPDPYLRHFIVAIDNSQVVAATGYYVPVTAFLAALSEPANHLLLGQQVRIGMGVPPFVPHR